MNRILFVCHGNICRSVMAQWIMQDLIDKNGLSDRFETDSAAVSSEETGNTIYPKARLKLQEKHIPIGKHYARRINSSDYQTFDEIYLMDAWNARLIRRLLPHDPQEKIHYLLDDEEIDDPWYTQDFETAFQQIQRGCIKRLEELSHQPIQP